MYVTLLSEALDLADTDVDDDALLDHVRQCRVALPSHNLGAGVWSETAVVTEIAYDRSLFRLAARWHIEFSLTNSVPPRMERDRLDLDLQPRGVDFKAPPHQPDDS